MLFLILALPYVRMGSGKHMVNVIAGKEYYMVKNPKKRKFQPIVSDTYFLRFINQVKSLINIQNQIEGLKMVEPFV